MDPETARKLLEQSRKRREEHRASRPAPFDPMPLDKPLIITGVIKKEEKK